MTILKSVTVAALLVGANSLAMAQNGLPTGGEPPVAGGAGGNPANGGYYGYYATGGYLAAPGYAAPGYAATYGGQPGYVEVSGAEEPSAAPGYIAATHHTSMYMYVPPHRSSHHTQKMAPGTNAH